MVWRTEGETVLSCTVDSSALQAASGIARVIRRPGVGRFQLGGDADEDVLPAVGGDELDADGQAGGVAVQRAG